MGQSGTSPLELWLYSRGNPLTSLQYTALPGGEGPSSGGETGGGCSGEQDTALATRRKFARFPRGRNDGLLEPCCFTARSYVRLKLAVPYVMIFLKKIAGLKLAVLHIMIRIV